MREGIDISGYDHITLTFWKLIDDDFESDDWLKVEVYDGSAWTEKFKWTSGDSLWQQHTLRLDDTASFKMRITAQIADEDNKFGIDNIILKVENDDQDITPADTAPPVIVIPADITGVPRSSLGYYAEFDVTATDSIDGTVNVTCSHSTGYFQIGVTTVSCNAADAAGNRASESFTITVTDGRPADGDGFHDGIDQCPDEAGDGNYGCPEDEQTHELRGGDAIRIFGNNPLHITGSQGTAGLILNYTGTPALLTASHNIHLTSLYRVVSLDTDTLSLILPEIGSTILSDSNVSMGSSTNSDAVLIEISNDNITPKINELQTNNGTIQVIDFGGLDDFSRGTEVEISARHNDGIGHISYTNVTVSLETHVLTEQVSATYPSQKGDSGGPIFINCCVSQHD